ncbi:MAG: Gfo/Idh/MocA family oxidoreductase [Alphaproteobacteria bacterium]|nr:Gfo/Idh/MocA family oxidoreductase [Alphaproteobacteria bacterium]
MARNRLGVIGFGIMGERLVRAALDQGADTTEIVGIWDPSEAAMARLAEGLPDVPRMDSAEAVIDAADCVYVATPPASHIAYGTRILNAGKALFLEKPLSHDMEEARDFVAFVEGGGHRAAVNFIFASSPSVDQLKTWARDGLLGETVERISIDVAFANWPRPWQMAAADWLSKRAEGGFTREVVSHFLFLARRLAGPLELKKASVSYPDDGESCEDNIGALIESSGVPIQLSGRVGATNADDTNMTVITGDAGAIRLRDWSIAELRLFDGSWGEAPNAIPHAEMRPLLLKGQLEKLAAMTRGEEHSLATVREALEVQEIVEAILASDQPALGGGGA